MSMGDQGFVLYEGMLSLVIIGILTSMILPAVIEIQQFRIAVSDERQAIRLLSYEIGMSEADSDLPDYYRKFELLNSNGTAFTCLTWPGAKELDHEWCLETLQQ
ncbi:type II secretion system protein [Salisediminibacterium beveridgei]|uniref:Prepilin-type N-terminal cleavage/methylation domain-containing protein n=1 Tax=Salisediminibacterium beveridgei TaxID=632773 RepID=A0A1D7QUF1_9BACI|nr:type II secretion system protein [Salisediminibacterium beveridgei]AOM82650.1 hypothetical protein BBEV_1285 [Salisediminibacterium beveridgei]